ncbi:hydantoinase B/oxoprolinase family protein (plasmid) [Haloferax mediterranei ATCC 33500]|uniref:Hydantoinase B/oxoprolinase family protein n=1 Tax=Haloferax mediterranei (strain ATCC 33500 / DSM 1411 / JCM 8866 / NBRC 14739 / NCIMB 2177 / R-4) TaxID=523841 RepID=I3R9X3_HALMT|nr:hydantoinase B/oxoprolinase family protein [Haloferax mediterranei]AFK21033.1 N-methylhydantoinase B (ATP-hydrolyzing) [Haloferax mediterranei ATCC 33500]AHZ24106.1 N-methylhydantoinase [Haloferax mediterranei ATCC 33500]EMA05181.1 N-methylhydantoinase B (ATP-hydrolyzing) [Haloferax mediterranei ATCC 33500]MDX5989744.1 hydantoinase B/oxoprolinase family protein [Haloferax mediterranei ATCC 33500]QCQ77194.1 hydantoinase B/oxoprolinase family protein [Haloferax mediterranei ATCC 33500]
MSAHSQTESTVTVDPFTREVITNAIQSAAEEMFINLGRTAKSSVIYETLDYACGITDADANVVAQANGVPGFLGTLKFCVQDTIEKFGTDGFAPGDVVLLNDYHGGTHLNDVAMVAPIFVDGELVGFTASKAHWTDVGGKDPGSWTTDATSIFQEGIQYPMVKLYEGGECNEAVRDIVMANTRLPDVTHGDMEAQRSSMQVGAERAVEVFERYGVSKVKAAISEYFDAGERLVREEIRTLPNGTYTATDNLDDDGITNEPVHVEVTVTIDDETVELDYTGTDSETAGPINSPYAASVSDIRAFFQAITLPDAETNEGFFRPLEITIPEGTVLNASKPAPIGTDWEGSAMAADLPWKALAPHLPDRLSAGHFLSVCATIVGGHDERTDEDFLVVEPQPGGWGASPGRDGADVLVCSGDGDTLEMPVEVMETRFPILFDEFRLDTPQEAGHGQFRGGTGLVQGYRIYNDSGGFITAGFGRSKFPPWGVNGGKKGDGNYIEIERTDGTLERHSNLTNYPLHDGDIARLVTSAGGGWGDPMARDPERVREDYLDDYITRETARSVYGVALSEDGTVDERETSELRVDERGTNELRANEQNENKLSTSKQRETNQ